MSIKLLCIFALTGALCGAVINITMGYPFYRIGGILGGMLTGILMFFI